jgi:hypothetical protein
MVSAPGTDSKPLGRGKLSLCTNIQKEVDSAQMAVYAYDAAIGPLAGEFARLNFRMAA